MTRCASSRGAGGEIGIGPPLPYCHVAKIGTGGLSGATAWQISRDQPGPRLFLCVWMRMVRSE